MHRRYLIQFVRSTGFPHLYRRVNPSHNQSDCAFVMRIAHVLVLLSCVVGMANVRYLAWATGRFDLYVGKEVNPQRES